jgi:hypothetical protein
LNGIPGGGCRQNKAQDRIEISYCNSKISMSFKPPLEPVVMAFIGEPKTGKSTLIKSIMHYYAQAKYFKFGLVITGSKWNGDFDFIKNEKAVWDKYDEERFKEYIDVLTKRAEALKKKGKKLPKSFVILDDLLGTLDSSDFFKSFLARYRQWNITLMIASQYAGENKGCSTLLRAVCDIAFMFPVMMANGVEAIHRAWGGWYKKESDFRELLMKVKQVDHACLLFQKQEKEIDKAYLMFKCDEAPKNFALTF